MVAAGVPEPKNDHTHAIAAYAPEVQQILAERAPRAGSDVGMRTGIRPGTVVPASSVTANFFIKESAWSAVYSPYRPA